MAVLQHAKPEVDETLRTFLVPTESVLYHEHHIYITNLRLIKFRKGRLSHWFHYFYHTFEDLDLSMLESIKAKNVLNFRLFLSGLIIMLLGPVGMFISAIPGLGSIGYFITDVLVADLRLGGLVIIGLLLIASSLIIRDRFVEFRGAGTIIRTRGFYDEELQKIRVVQRTLVKKNG